VQSMVFLSSKETFHMEQVGSHLRGRGDRCPEEGRAVVPRWSSGDHASRRRRKVQVETGGQANHGPTCPTTSDTTSSVDCNCHCHCHCHQAPWPRLSTSTAHMFSVPSALRHSTSCICCCGPTSRRRCRTTCRRPSKLSLAGRARCSRSLRSRYAHVLHFLFLFGSN
jgi:hypothetical protein